MKKLALAAVFAGAASTAMAGSYAKGEVEMEPVVVVEETKQSSSSAGILIPLLLVAVLAAAAAK
ncbi:MAG: ferrochelatase [Pelagimonas sp.]|nr:ferrochelatase [Pelagimonas sp.]